MHKRCININFWPNKSGKDHGGCYEFKGKKFLTLKDYTQEEILYLLDLAAELKDKKKKGILTDTLKGKMWR